MAANCSEAATTTKTKHKVNSLYQDNRQYYFKNTLQINIICGI